MLQSSASIQRGKGKRPEPTFVLRAHAASVQAVKYVPNHHHYHPISDIGVSEEEEIHLDKHPFAIPYYSYTSPTSISSGYLFSGDADGMVYLWNLETRRVVGSIDARKMEYAKTSNQMKGNNFNNRASDNDQMRSNNKPGNKHLNGIMGIFHPTQDKILENSKTNIVIIQRRDGWIGVYTYTISPDLTNLSSGNRNTSNATSIELLHTFPTNSYHYCKAALDRWQDKVDDTLSSVNFTSAHISSSDSNCASSLNSFTSKAKNTLIASPCDDTGAIAIYDYDAQPPTNPLRYFTSSSNAPSSSGLTPKMNNKGSNGLCMAIIMYREILIGGYENGTVCIFDINTGEILSETKVSENSILSLDITSDGKGGIVGTTGDDLITFDIEWKFSKKRESQERVQKTGYGLLENGDICVKKLHHNFKENNEHCSSTSMSTRMKSTNETKSKEKSLLSEIFSKDQPYNEVNIVQNNETEDQDNQNENFANKKVQVKSIEIKNLVTLQQKRPGTSYIRLRKDNKIFLAGSWDHRVQIYDHKKKKHLANLAYHKDSVYSCDFNQYTNCFAVGSKDGTITLWDLYSGN